MGDLIDKAIKSVFCDGIIATAHKVKNYCATQRINRQLSAQHYEPYMDVLFINGCDPASAPHPPRYRISHQKEQLIANNIVSSEVYYTNLSMDHVRSYRLFIFFRCPVTPLIREFIAEAKKLHKTVLFDIDDLVIDTKYTDSIPYVKSLSKKEKSIYDDGVIRMGETLSLCDAAITTTERLAEELSHYVPEVYINRNTASERMFRLSEEFLQKKKKAVVDLELISPKYLDENGLLQWTDEVRIGYFSGSITHNSDFKMIMPAIIKIMEKNKKVTLHIVGELNLPEEMRGLSDRVVKREFVPWEKLPELIGSVDINLAPIEENIFNEAKSENKWVEAALVKVPTIASRVGAFERMIDDGKTGILCGDVDEWYEKLNQLVENEDLRHTIAENAYQYCKKHCVTIYTGFPLTKYIKSKLTPNVAFVLPSLEISGGIMVALRHAKYLFEDGFDVLIISEVPGTGWLEYMGHKFPVISKNHHPIYAHFEKTVATMWTTVEFLETYPNIKQRYYLVQNFEVDFYTPETFLRIRANQSYSPSQQVQFLTISKWCQRWLWESYEKKSLYAPNGIDAAQFRPHRRELHGKIRILIEGDCAAYYKNVDESFQIIERLDPSKYEVWYMSYNAEPKPKYRVDRFLHRVAYEKVFEVYAQCDILIKSSFLESFSYPPLEMMASGGYVLVVLNDGNAEYLRDGENCLLYEKGNIKQAVQKIGELCKSPKLQELLYKHGLETAKSRDWASIRTSILSLYGIE